MSKRVHSGKVKVSNGDLGVLIRLAPPEALLDLGEMSPGPDEDILVEAIKLVPLLSSIRGDDLLLESAGAALERVEKLLTDHDYPLDIADWHLNDENL